MTIKKSLRITLNTSIAANATFNGRCTIKNSAGETIQMMKSDRKMWGKEYDEKKDTHYMREIKTGDVLAIDYVWETDEQGKILSQAHNDEKDVYNFICSHVNVAYKSEVNHNGHIIGKSRNKNMKTALFLLEILEDTVTERDKNFGKTLSAMNIVNDMAEEQRKDLVYFYGGDPAKMDAAQIKTWLVDSRDGIVLAPASLDNFLAMMDKDSKASGKFTGFNNKILFNKAIKLKKIEFSNGQYYTESGIPMGFSIEEAENYLLQNDTYSNALKTVVRHDDYLFNHKGEMKHEEVKVTGSTILDSSFEEKKKWAQERKIPGASNILNHDLLDGKIREYLKREAGNKAVEKEQGVL